MADSNAEQGRYKARLRWLCRRGMKELDVLLAHYMDTYYDTAGAAQQEGFARLLDRQDPVLYDLILGTGTTDDPDEQRVIKALRAYAAR